jgi:hypothetical protein
MVANSHYILKPIYFEARFEFVEGFILICNGRLQWTTINIENISFMITRIYLSTIKKMYYEYIYC